MSNMIKVENLWFRYSQDSEWALQGIDLEVKKGEFLCVTKVRFKEFSTQQKQGKGQQKYQISCTVGQIIQCVDHQGAPKQQDHYEQCGNTADHRDQKKNDTQRSQDPFFPPVERVE